MAVCLSGTRQRIFEKNEKYLGMSVCPRHRDAYGIRWRCSKKSCSVPTEWSAHKTKVLKGDRGITFPQSLHLYTLASVLVPVASPICKKCRLLLAQNTTPTCHGQLDAPSVSKEEFPRPEDLPHEAEQIVSTEQDISSPLESAESDQEQGSITGLVQATANLSIVASDDSPYIPETTGSSSASESSGIRENQALRRPKLNEFLSVSGKASVSQPKKTWDQLSTRTKNVRVSKAKDAVVASLEVISPENPASLWEALKSSKSVETALCTMPLTLADHKYLGALAETYENANSWDTRRQVLSIIADLVPYSVIQQFIPCVTEYRIKVAREHTIQHGRGVPLSAAKSPRVRVDESQLDHFLSFITSPHVVQDLPFGQRYLYLTNGVVLETPNVIRSMIPQRITEQYKQFCSETNFVPFSSSTMIRILSSCKATVRKSLHGLDYFAAEGAKAFDDLTAVVERLWDRNWVLRFQQALKEGKQYLKTDYKVHITTASNIPDHCSTYALSDPKEDCLDVQCDHFHDKRCPSCDELKSTIMEIESCLSSSQLPEDDRDDLVYTFRQARLAIDSWKAHQLRSIQQDKARISVLESLDSVSVLITQDWAMKFLPQKYRETQADWFAKRGISWHINVVVRMHDDKLQHQAFVHIVENCNQDSEVVVNLIKHTLQELKKQNPEITTAYLRQDNAGCYHSVTMIAACEGMEEATGIKVERVDFSDPQGGKGPCDRKAATIEAHVLRYINEGNDVETANDLRKAILSYGGVRGVRVALVDSRKQHPPISLEGKLDGVSNFNNCHYGEECLTVWKAFDVGEGKAIPWSQLQVQIGSLGNPVFPDSPFSTGDFQDVPRFEKELLPVPRPRNESTEKEENIASTENQNGLFSCPVEGCVRTFQRHCNLERHMHYGTCKFVEEKYTLLDKAKMLYTEKLQKGSSAQPFITGTALSEQSVEVLPKGWALRSAKKAARFSAKQKAYLDEKFKIGEQTGHKADPAQVATDMRRAKHEDGSRKFSVDEFLSEQQIKSYFSRMAAKQRRQGVQEDVDELDIQASTEQEAYSSTRAQILDDCQLIHPITYDTYNLCDMVARKKLTKLSVAMLRMICHHFDLDVEGFSQRLKKPYIELIEDMVKQCSCD